jgi:DNA-directed RNA polymerase beta subunit
MLQKLYALAKNKISPDSLDSMLTQEVLLPGQAIQIFLIRRLQEMLRVYARVFAKNATKKGVQLRDCMIKSMVGYENVGNRVANFLSTGNFVDSFKVGLREVERAFCKTNSV